MAYNLASIRNRIRIDKLDDPEYDAEVIDRFINDAIRSVVNAFEFPFMEKVFLGTLPETETTFVFPTDYALMQSLKIVGPTGVQRDITDKYINFRDFNTRWPTPRNNSRGMPDYWTLHGNKLYVNRPTDAAYETEMYYIKTPKELQADTDVPEIPQEFEEIIVLGALARVQERNEDFDLAAVTRSAFSTMLNELYMRTTKRHSATPIIMGQPLRMRLPRSR